MLVALPIAAAAAAAVGLHSHSTHSHSLNSLNRIILIIFEAILHAYEGMLNQDVSKVNDQPYKEHLKQDLKDNLHEFKLLSCRQSFSRKRPSTEDVLSTNSVEKY